MRRVTKKELRTAEVVGRLRVRQSLNVREVSASLSVSEATVRRLFSELEHAGKAIRTHGGIRLAPELDLKYSYRRSTSHRVREKTAIGNAAAELVDSGDRLFLDSGTTVMKLAEALSIRLQTRSVEDVLVLTNSLDLADAVGGHCKVILLGGEVRLDRRDVSGSISESVLSRFRLTKAFLGADGISVENGFMTTDEQTARIDEMVIERVNSVFVLSDSEKFDRTSFVTYAPLAAAERLYTDSGLDDKSARVYMAAGARLVRVAADSAGNA